jgi:hypothetical protein
LVPTTGRGLGIASSPVGFKVALPDARARMSPRGTDIARSGDT